MMNDISQYGAAENLGFFWIKEDARYGGSKDCVLVAIDELGEVSKMPGRRPLDTDAPTEAEAVLEHLQGSIRQADTNLERRKRRLDEEGRDAPEKKRPVDAATARFFEDDD